MVTRTLIALSLVAGLLLAGCNDEDPSGNGPDRDPSSQSTSTSTDATTTTDPSAPAATGTLVEGDHFSYRLPAELEWTLGRSGQSASAFDDDLNLYRVDVVSIPLQAGDPGEDVDADFRDTIDPTKYDAPLVRGENRVVDGVEGWTAQTVEDGRLVYVFGAYQGRHSFDITFDFQQKDPRSPGWVEAVLASLKWK